MTNTRTVTIGTNADIATIGQFEALLPADITSSGTNEIWVGRVLEGAQHHAVQINATVGDSSHYVRIYGPGLPNTISMYGHKAGGSIDSSQAFLISSTSIYLIIEDLCLYTTDGNGNIRVTGNGAYVILRRIVVSGSDRNPVRFECSGVNATLVCEGCVGLYSGDSTNVGSFRCGGSTSTMICINCIAVGPAYYGFVRTAGTAVAINCYAFGGNGFIGGWIMSNCASSATTPQTGYASYVGGGGYLAGNASISGGASSFSATGDSLHYYLGYETETPRTEGAIVVDVQWNSSGASANEYVINLNPSAIFGSSSNNNRIIVFRSSSEAASLLVFTSGGSGTTVTGPSVADTSRHVLTSYWTGWTGSAAAGSAGIGIDGGSPTVTSGLTVTRNTSGNTGDMTIGNTHDGSRTVPLNGSVYRYVVFSTKTPTINGNTYDLTSTYNTNDLFADIEVESSSYANDTSVYELDYTVVMGNGDIQCYHDFSENEADMIYRKGRSITYNNVSVSQNDAAVFARMNPYLNFVFEPGYMSGANPSRRLPHHPPYARVNHSGNYSVSGDVAVTEEGLSTTTGYYAVPGVQTSGKSYGGSDRTMLVWFKVFNGPVTNSQRGFVHVRESSITNNCFALSTTSSGEFTARYTNGSGSATVATSVTKIGDLADGDHLIRVTLSQSTLLLSIEIDEVLDGTADATGKANQSNGPQVNMRVGTFNDGTDRPLGNGIIIQRVYVLGTLLDITDPLPVFYDNYGVQDNLFYTQYSQCKRGGAAIEGSNMPIRYMDNQGQGNMSNYIPIGPSAGQRILFSGF